MNELKTLTMGGKTYDSFPDTTARDAVEELRKNPGSSIELDTTLSVEGAAADAKAVGDAVGALSEEIGELNDGARETEYQWNIIVGRARPDYAPNNLDEGANRMTVEEIIPIHDGLQIECENLARYRWAVAVFDENLSIISTTGWVVIQNMSFTQGVYAVINFRRTDETPCTQEDADALLAGIRIFDRVPIYIKTINHVAPDADGNLNLSDAQETYAEINLINGVTNSHTGKFEYTAANRATIADFISVIKGGKITFMGGATYNYSPIRFTTDMEAVGYMGWIDSAVFELDYTGLLKFNIQRKDGGDMVGEELNEIAKLIKVLTTPIKDPVQEYQAEVRADLINSLNIEYGRSDGASWQYVRIPHETNDGRTVRPVVRLTSEDGSLTGQKCSAPDYAAREKTAFVINAGLFDVATNQPIGQTIIDGVSIVNEPHPQGANGETISETECYPLCIDGDGVLSAPYDRNVDTADMIADGIVQATTGWVTVVEDYQIAADEIATEIVHPGKYVQQIIGQFYNGDYCVLSVANKGYTGSAPNDNGLTYTECAQLLVDKGVKFAYALDGGGSCQTVVGKRQINPKYDGRSAPSVIVFEAI